MSIATSTSSRPTTPATPAADSDYLSGADPKLQPQTAGLHKTQRLSKTRGFSMRHLSPKTVRVIPTARVSPYLDRLGVLPWTQSTNEGKQVDEHDPRSAYVETFWLPVLGPSTTLLLRRLAEEFDGAPDGFEIDCASLSREIGLGPRLDKRGAFGRTLDRCTKFHMVQLQGDLLYVRRALPRLSQRQVSKLSERLQVLHHGWTIDAADDGAQRRIELVRAAHLARTLLALGESTHDAERQLQQWHFHPSIAWHAVQWALTDPAQIP